MDLKDGQDAGQGGDDSKGADNGAGDDGAGGDNGADSGASEGATLESIQAKLDAGEELTVEEQAVIDSQDDNSDDGKDDKGDDSLTAEEQALLEKVSPKMQKRIEQLAADKKALELRLEKLESGTEKKDGSKPLSDFTEAELFNLVEQKPEYNPYVMKELAKREAERIYGEGNKAASVEKIKQESAAQAVLKYPDLNDSDSALYKLAQRIYTDRGYHRIPDGDLVAADRAAEILRKQKKSSFTNESKRRSEIKKFGLSGAGKPASAAMGSTSKRLEELEAKAVPTRPGSQEWKDVFLERRRLKNLQARQK